MALRSIDLEIRWASQLLITCLGTPSTLANVVRKTSWRETIVFNAFCNAATFERAVELDRHHDVVKRAVGIQLIDEPQALLGEGKRQIAVSGGAHQRRRAGTFQRRWRRGEKPESPACALSARRTIRASRLPWEHCSADDRRRPKALRSNCAFARETHRLSQFISIRSPRGTAAQTSGTLVLKLAE